jgi:nicotinate-nucleotide adenylyltransferase
MIANYMTEFEGMDEVWFIVSPQNPFKEKDELIPEKHRFRMVEIAVENMPNVKACDIEFSMPLPSYTIDTLKLLEKEHPGITFHILMGNDNIILIKRWKDADSIMNDYHKLVYPRNGYPVDEKQLPPKTKLSGAPMIDISSTMLREWLSGGHNIRAFLPAGVYDYIISNGLYIKHFN